MININDRLKGIVIIVGNYGSGKTEVSVNLAINGKRAGRDVCIADLDLVNPYFRTREARGTLSGLGISVILPPDIYLKADLPILTPAVSGIIRKPRELTILDVGGDGVGATVLSALADALKNAVYQMIQVINPFRPYTDTILGCLNMRNEIEKASRLSITGIISNANLIDETTSAEIYEGYEFICSLSNEMRLPVELITVPSNLMPEIDISRFHCPVLCIERQLVPPWKKPVKVDQNFQN